MKHRLQPRLSIRLAVAVLCLGGVPSAYADLQVVVPFADGMTITTSDSVANVEVHAKSFGPGFCSVTFTASPGGSPKQIAAPPAAYSSWVVIASHIGVVTYTISYDVGCDTGVLAEIRYFK